MLAGSFLRSGTGAEALVRDKGVCLYKKGYPGPFVVCLWEQCDRMAVELDAMEIILCNVRQVVFRHVPSSSNSGYNTWQESIADFRFLFNRDERIKRTDTFSPIYPGQQAVMIDFEELLEKYQALLAQNSALREENDLLKARLGVSSPVQIDGSFEASAKIRLFMSLFRGRDDVYARRWENREGRSGYAPVCLNEWKSGICGKPGAKCSACRHKSYAAPDEKVIENHLRGNIVVGMYPLLHDETCHFLAIDLDGQGWQKDVSTLRDVCTDFNIPVAVERSRSGNGAHAWFFFTDPIKASLARKLGTTLLTSSMNSRHELEFSSYDRLLPNQDTMPKGGLGNLIALPLQKKAREGGNSVFIDEKLHPYEDQWGFLAGIVKLTEADIAMLISRICHGDGLGVLKSDQEDEAKPWLTSRIRWTEQDFPKRVELIRANMIYVRKSNLSERALNEVKRLAAFKNPDFYKAQALRMPTFNKPRIISCSDETTEYLCLPRGCDADVAGLLADAGAEAIWCDHTNPGRCIKVVFTGDLREEQRQALNEMMKHDHGVLSAAPAFGKTVIAAKLIAQRKTNTLILTHRKQLLAQWITRLSEFLSIDEELPAPEKKRGRKKRQSLIGQIGAGKENPSGIIDVAIMQSLNCRGEVKDLIRNYGMVIVDECHHVPAFSFEQILKHVHARYVYGLTATPVRSDGHHPIIFMHCGPVRYKVDAKTQAEKRPFAHYVIPRFTGLRIPFAQDEKDLTIQELYTEIAGDELRNQLLVQDVIKNYQEGRHSLVLTERTAHVASLSKMLREKIPDAITLIGGRGTKETKDVLARIRNMPDGRQLTLIATGKYIGEGFDEPRLDTLFLAMPISWKGTLQQYAGRLHRLSGNKKEVRIYDYVDIQVRMLEKMYGKRLAGYAAIGYRAKAESIADEPVDSIFDKSNFLPVYSNDMMNASREIVIVSPFVAKRRSMQMLEYMNAALGRGVRVVVVTRPATDCKNSDRPALEATLDLLKKSAVRVVFRPNIHQKFAVLDRRIVWYGSINLLSFGSAEESMMRLVSSNIAHELMESIMGRGRV